MDTLKNLLNIGAGRDENLQTLKRKARALQAKAEDIISELKQEEFQPGKRRRKVVDNWLKDVGEVVIQLQNLELRGKDLITSERSSAGLIEQIGDLTEQGSFPRGFTFYDHGSSSVALVTTYTKITDRMLYDNKRKVISWLIADGNISTVGIYGPGGVGKSMLLMEVHNELLERFKSSGRVYWISVSHGITLAMLQDKIAEAMDLSYLLAEKNAIRKAASLSYELKQRKDVFLLLDDVWEHFSLEDVGVPIGDESSCKLILTTRSLDVCRRMKCQETVKVEPLSKEKAWELFSKVLERRDQNSAEINELAELVAAECAGLPLGLIVMAGSMREVDDIQEWRNTLEELQNSSEGQSDIETNIFPVLKLSYDRLKDKRLKECFLLCALYPKYGEIVRDELIGFFRSEGLLDKINGWQKQYDKGHSMLNKLENACLLEKYDSRCVKMHNFIRDMAIRITNIKPRYMIAAGAELRRIPSGRRWTIDLDKASLMHNSLSEIHPGTIPMCPELTTLLLQRNPFTKLPDSFFVYMKALKVLNLSKTSIKRLPDSISELTSLRSLLLEFCKRLHFVPSVVKLTSLRELDFSFCWSMNHVPHGMKKLTDLRFLNLKGCKDLCQLLSGSLSTLSRIQCLKLDPDVQSISGDDVLKMEYLERLEGCRISDVSSFNKYVKTQHFQQLKYYEFVVGAGEFKRVDYTINTERMVILSSGSLKKGGSEGDLFVPPENTQDLQIHNSEFDARSLIDDLPSLIRLTALKKIHIRRCRGIEAVWSPITCLEAIHEKFHFNAAVVLLLQCLQELILTDLHDFRGLVKEGIAIQQGAFSNLKILAIKYCPNIKELFTSNLLIGSLDNLQQLEVEGCEELEQIVAAHDDDGREMIIDLEGYVNKDSDLIWLPNLRTLHLRCLPKLKGICHRGLLGKCSVEQITVEYCAEIKQIFKSSLAQHHLSNLREVKVAACKNLEEIIASPNSQGQGSGIYELPKLRVLELDDLPCLTSFFHGIIPTCCSIEQINITNCPIVKKLPISVPLSNNGEGLSLHFLQEIKAEQEWWKSLEWDDPFMKHTLLPFTNLSEAGGSSFSIFEELGSPERLHELQHKISNTKVNGAETADISSCLTLLSDVLP